MRFLAFPHHLLSVLMKVRWFDHIVEQHSPWLLLLWTPALWPWQCSHPQLSWKTTNRLLVCVLWSRNPTPGTFLQPILCSEPAAPGSVRRCEPTRPTYPSVGSKGTDPIRHTGNMSCWAQTGFPEVCKGTAGSGFSVLLKKQQGRVETRDLEKGGGPPGAICTFNCSWAFWKGLSRR